MRLLSVCAAKLPYIPHPSQNFYQNNHTFSHIGLFLAILHHQPIQNAMYITVEELKAVLYEYQVEQITDGDDEIADEAIKAAELLVRGYLDSANKRRETASLTKQQYRAWKLYDIDAIFSKTGTERNSLLMRIIKRIAAYNIIELSCPDVLSERIQSIYDGTLELLSKIAGEGEYAKNRFVIPDADYIDETGSDETQGEEENPLTMPFRMVSRKKFRHEPL